MMLDPRAPEHEIAAAAMACVGRTRSHLGAYLQRPNTASTLQELQGTLNGLAVQCQARPVAADVPLSGVIARMTDSGWWRRNLRRSLLREAEAGAHAAGYVRRRNDCYVSEHAMRTLRARQKINRRTLECLEVVNETGQALNLQEVADGTVSNPKLRRAELMLRCRGFEETAEFFDHEAVFLTLTCPSRFHRFASDGRSNPAWRGATPKDGQAYLNAVWAKVRAEWKRRGFAPYGFRIAEPHHDGCSHWHILLFAPKRQLGWFNASRLVADRNDHGAGIVGIVGAYALEDSPGERGAVRHRFTWETIDPAKGSATGYIAKYICKNVDGEKEDGDAVGLDFASGKGTREGAQRVRAWASTWGIRQFQQIGGPSVTVWRELRRLGKDAEPLQLDLLEGARRAADEALWFVFWLVQGGPSVPRAELKLRPRYEDKPGGRFDDVVRRVTGVLSVEDGQALTTRLHEWTVQRAGQAATDAADAAWGHTLRAARAAFGAHYEAARGIPRRSGCAAAWTGDNNCTEPGAGDESSALREDFLRGRGGQPVKESPPCVGINSFPGSPPRKTMLQ